MVTIRPIPRAEIRCNACDELIGTLTNETDPSARHLERPKGAVGNHRRMRMYDVKSDGEHLYDHECEVDLCPKCSIKFDKVIKKFGINKSTVKILEVEV